MNRLLSACILTMTSAFAVSQFGPDFKLDATNSFPFVIPWDDAVKGTATDVSFLNEKPAGKNGAIIVKDGVFVEEKTGKRVRFFGTNLAARTAFPTRADAPKIAAHLAKMGVNIVRFHHLQNDWDKEFGMIWKKGKEQIELDPAQLDCLDFFVNELKKQGIYININLQTTRKMIPELGIPASAMEIPDFQKKVDKLNDKMIALQKQYAKDLLDRKSPYTGLKYKDDPAIMVVEINNENSLCGWPGEQPGAGLEKWPEPFQTELRSKWNGWLKKKYGDDATFVKAWPTKDTRTGPSITSYNTKWSSENQSNGDVKVSSEGGSASTAPSLTATINSNNGPSWHVQAHLGGLNFVNGRTYTVEFRGKADRSIALSIDSRLDKPDWRFLGLGGSVQLGINWKTYSLTFTATGTEPNHARVGFVLGDVRGTINIENLSIREGSLETGIEPGQSLVKANIGIPTVGASQKYRDYASFLIETEANYGKQMRSYLRDTLGFKKANIIDTQVSWGGLTSIIREKDSEFTDNHEYWNHPVFLGGSWDPKNYRVDRRALVNDPGFGTLGSLSKWRIVGKPYSVSEYNHPAPSDFQCETMPLYGSVAAMQDWDIIYTFSYEGTGSREKNDMYDGYFDFGRNPTKMAFFSTTALLFRQGLFAPLDKTEFAPVTSSSWQTASSAAALFSNPNILKTRLGLKTSEINDRKADTEDGTVAVREGELGKQYIKVESRRALMLSGFIGDRVFETSFGSFTIGKTPTNFASLTLVPLDGKPLDQSERLLLTLVGRVENTNMGWNTARDSVSDNWGTGPTLAENIKLSGGLKDLKVNKMMALDGSGRPVKEVMTSSTAGVLLFQISKNTQSLWYELSVKK